MAASRDLGEFIRELRKNARISLRQLAEQAGVSNPYLSQIERGLRRPSAEVLQQLANALRVSTPLLYLRAGLLAEREGQGVLAAIAADPDLTERHKRTLIEIYEAFRRENARTGESPEPAPDPGTDHKPAPSTTDVPPEGDTPVAVKRTVRKTTTRARQPAADGTPRRTAGKAARKAATGTADRPATRPEKEKS
jgi:transcriptional regulator with XRE-family HTH domain